MLPDYITDCLNTLSEHNINAYLVGGCVRDMLLCTAPDDYDITTDASPRTICEIFPRVIKTGIKHGTVTVMYDRHPIEITQMRTEGEYSDFRRPDFVVPCDDINADLRRRDFTVNAMAMDKDMNIVDLFCGQDDLKSGIIRAVGNPQRRFTEDALRIMRAFRFSAKLGFSIEENTLKSALELSGNLKYVSAERVFTELQKTLMSQNPQNISPLINCGGLSPIFINECSDISKISKLPKSILPRFAMFLLLTNADVLVCDKLKVPNKLKKFAVGCIENIECTDTDTDFKRIISKIGRDFATDFFRVYFLYHNKDFNENRIKSILQSPCTIADLAVNGIDLKSLGIEGVNIKKVLSKLLCTVYENTAENDRERLITLAKHLKGELK